MYKPMCQLDFIKIARGESWQKYLAVNKITNQAILGKIAYKNKDYLIRTIAVQKLKTQGMLEIIISEEKNHYVKKIAISSLRRLRVIQNQNQNNERPLRKVRG